MEKAAKSLLKLATIVDGKNTIAPSFLMIATGTIAAYKKDDGVLIVPVGCLKN